MAQYVSDNTVLDDFMSVYPHFTDYEARSVLGAFLFSGEDVFKTVSMLSGGERVRLALCKILCSKPNFLILDEPTNHLDIIGKETLEEMLNSYSGTVLFVSHDRYFIKQIAKSVLSFEKDGVNLYPYGYEQYLEMKKNNTVTEQKAEKTEKVKKTYTTPAKEKAKRQRAIAKTEEKIALLEEKLAGIMTELTLEDNLADYIKLSELQKEQEEIEYELQVTMNEWERLCEEESACKP